MHPARIAELLQPFVPDDQPLATDDLRHISTYIDLLLRWNARINLTSIRNPDDIVTRHFGESLFAARHLFPDRAAAARLADLGSGAGFPGIPIKLWAPHIAVTLIESSSRKAAFLREVARALTLTNINILNVRAEALLRAPADDPGRSFDVVTLRAVERFARALPLAAALLAPAGRIALLIGAAQIETARATLPGFSWQQPVPVPLSALRVLLISVPGRAPLPVT